jgi:transcription elongation factor Elf1
MIVAVGNGFQCPKCKSVETNVIFDAESGWTFVCGECDLIGAVELTVRWQEGKKRFSKTICKIGYERKGRALRQDEKGPWVVGKERPVDGE